MSSRTARLRFFLGKGGVGKTTCAAATAVRLAESGRRVLALSLDPAHSLADAFGLASCPRATPVDVRKGTLKVLELDAAKALERWTSKRRPALRLIAERVTFLEPDEVTRLFEAAIPGADEIISLFEVMRSARASRLDDVVVDLAPTGHALRLLAMPELLDRVASALATLVEGQSVVATALSGRLRAGIGELLVAELKSDAAAMRKSLTDPAISRFTWVTHPQPLALAESEDGLASLKAAGLPLDTIVVNQLTPAPRTRCVPCEGQRREESQIVAELTRRHADTRIVSVARKSAGPRGVAALRSFGAGLEKKRIVSPPTPETRTRTRRARGSESLSLLEEVVPPATRLLFVGGKGGVGKTTTASALALALARQRPRSRVLLVSADPAHSLADALEATLEPEGSTLTIGRARLHVKEIDAEASFRARTASWHASVDQLLVAERGGWATELPYERAALHEALDLLPPGVDELMGTLELLDALDAGFDTVVVDTAPTGHALQLLEAPRVVQEWAQTLMRVLLASGRVGRVGELGRELVSMSTRCRRLQELLREPAHARFVVVTRPDELSMEESRRLLARLAALRICVGAVVLNGRSTGSCSSCRRRAAKDERVARELVRCDPPRPLLLAGQQPTTPRGTAALVDFMRTWEVASRWRARHAT